MARAHSIYIVEKYGCLYGAFTVKHELITALKKNYEDRSKWTIHRLIDKQFHTIYQNTDVTEEIKAIVEKEIVNEY